MFSLNLTTKYFMLLAAHLTLVHGSVKGFDISNYEGTVDFNQAYSDGARFVIIKVRRATN